MGYETDLTDEQWAFIEPRFLEFVGNYGNRAEWPKRELINGVLYLLEVSDYCRERGCRLSRDVRRLGKRISSISRICTHCYADCSLKRCDS